MLSNCERLRIKVLALMTQIIERVDGNKKYLERLCFIKLFSSR